MYDTVLQHHLILKSWESLKARSHWLNSDKELIRYNKFRKLKSI